MWSPPHTHWQQPIHPSGRATVEPHSHQHTQYPTDKVSSSCAYTTISLHPLLLPPQTNELSTALIRPLPPPPPPVLCVTINRSPSTMATYQLELSTLKFWFFNFYEDEIWDLRFLQGEHVTHLALTSDWDAPFFPEKVQIEWYGTTNGMNYQYV